MIENIVEDTVHALLKLVVLAGVIVGGLILVHCLQEDGYIAPKYSQYPLEETTQRDTTLSTKIVNKLETLIDKL